MVGEKRREMMTEEKKMKLMAWSENLSLHETWVVEKLFDWT